jgi:hypothetical protein
VSDQIVKLSEDFWNIRGTFRAAGVINVGTQSSLVRLASGRFALLDAYTLRGDIADEVMGRTDGGRLVDAVCNLHPFHTKHVQAVAMMFPHAKLYGTARHLRRFPDLPWQPERTEDPAFHELFGADFDFMVPRGVDFVPKNQALHFAGVLAFHRASGALHVDDTLNWIPFPWGGRLAFHPALKAVLERRREAASEFRGWATELAARCEDVRHVCTAHTKLAPLSEEPPGAIAERVRAALKRVEPVLRAHERG